MRITAPLLVAFALSGALSGALTGCDGGGDAGAVPGTNTGTPLASRHVRGLVEGGATGDCAGQPVTVKNASIERSFDVAGRTYDADVSGMSAPFLLEVTCTAGSARVKLHAAATEDDVNATVNITALSDLVVANTAAQASDDFFEAPDFTRITTDNINAARDQLRSRLQPVMTAFAVPAGFDLLRSTFADNNASLNGVLRSLRLQVDHARGIVTIANIVTGDTIADVIADATDDTVIPAPPGTVMHDGLPEMDAIAALLAEFSRQLAAGVPVSGTASGDAYEALFSSSFRMNTYADPYLLAYSGMRMAQPQRLRTATPGNWLIGVQVSRGSQSGFYYSTMRVLKENGAWTLHGDQRPLDFDIWPEATSSNTTTPDIQSVFYISLHNRDRAALPVERVQITGPGLPTTDALPDEPGVQPGIWFADDGTGSYFVQLHAGGTVATGAVRYCADDGTSPLPGHACVNRALLRSGSDLAVTGYDAAGTPLAAFSYTFYGTHPLAESDLALRRTAFFFNPELSPVATIGDTLAVNWAWPAEQRGTLDVIADWYGNNGHSRAVLATLPARTASATMVPAIISGLASEPVQSGVVSLRTHNIDGRAYVVSRQF